MFDAVDDAVYENKLVGAHREAILRLLDSIIELRDLEAHLLFMRPAFPESSLDTVFQEFSQAMAYYLKRADKKDAEALALHAARILAESPTTLDGLWKTMDYIICGIGQLCHVNVGVLSDALKRYTTLK